MKSLLFSMVAIPTSTLTLGTAITASVVYALASIVLGVAILVFLLLLFRGIAPRIVWGKRKKKLRFERISS